MNHSICGDCQEAFQSEGAPPYCPVCHSPHFVEVTWHVNERARLLALVVELHVGKCYYFNRPNQEPTVKPGACDDCRELLGVEKENPCPPRTTDSGS